MRRIGSRVLPVSASQSLMGTRLAGGPLVVCGWSFTDGVGTDTLTGDGSVIAPAAFTTIAFTDLPNGLYDVAWSVELTGAAAAADANNFELFIGATSIGVSQNQGAAGVYPQAVARAEVANGPLALAVTSIGAGTAGVTYEAGFTVTPVNDSTATINDGGLTIGAASVHPASAETKWFGECGPLVETEISVKATAGTIQGAIWYYLMSDLEHAYTLPAK